MSGGDAIEVEAKESDGLLGVGVWVVSSKSWITANHAELLLDTSSERRVRVYLNKPNAHIVRESGGFSRRVAE